MACIYQDWMKTPGDLRMVLLVLASTTALLGQVDAREIIRNSVCRRRAQLEGRPELRVSATGRTPPPGLPGWVEVIRGEDVRHNIAGRHALPANSCRETTARCPPLKRGGSRRVSRKSIAERRQETTAERAKRLSAYEQRPDWQREAWHELADAFDFRLAGEGRLDNAPIFLIEATPREGYQPRSRTAKLFRSLKARFWVDQRDHQIVKVEAEVIDTIWMGLFLVRVAKGSRATLELTRVSDGVWLPDRLQVVASARLGLLKTFRFEQRVHYSRYSCVPANARTIYPAEGRDSQSRIATMNRPAKVTSR